MAIQTFTSGQTLTAAQMTSLQANDYNQTVSTKTTSYTLAIGDLGTRVVMNSASATTITVNTSIFAAGDTLFIQNIGAGVCTVTAGTCTVSTSGSLALVQNAGGTLYFTSASAAIFIASGVTASAAALVYITGASFSASSTVSMASGVFTSTYSNYLVVLNITSSAGDAQQLMRVNNAGTPRGTSDYYGGSLRAGSASASAVTGSSAAGSWNLSATTSSSAFYPSVTFTVYEPTNASVKTRVSGYGFGANDSNQASGILFGGVYNVAEANDGLTWNTSTTITGFYKVYGIANL